MKRLLAIFLIGISCLLSACSDESVTHYNLGNAYYEQGKLNEAIAEYKKAIEIDPDFADAYYNLGNVYDEREELEQAIVHYKEFIRLARTNLALQSHLPKVERRIQQIEMESRGR